jgi:hypothetical protein
MAAFDERWQRLLGVMNEKLISGNVLAHAAVDVINAVLAAVGCNVCRLLAWLRGSPLRFPIAIGVGCQPETG